MNQWPEKYEKNIYDFYKNFEKFPYKASFGKFQIKQSTFRKQNISNKAIYSQFNISAISQSIVGITGKIS